MEEGLILLAVMEHAEFEEIAMMVSEERRKQKGEDASRRADNKRVLVSMNSVM